MDYLLTCQCGEVVVKESVSETKIRGKVLIAKGNSVYSVCRRCGEEVAVPVRIDQDLVKSLRTNPKLFIKSQNYR